MKRGSFIFLDSGTTVNELIPYLKKFRYTCCYKWYYALA
ncbi:hypothetical protein [Sneathia vaginalis]